MDSADDPGAVPAQSLDVAQIQRGDPQIALSPLAHESPYTPQYASAPPAGTLSPRGPPPPGSASRGPPPQGVGMAGYSTQVGTPVSAMNPMQTLQQGAPPMGYPQGPPPAGQQPSASSQQALVVTFSGPPPPFQTKSTFRVLGPWGWATGSSLLELTHDGVILNRIRRSLGDVACGAGLSFSAQPIRDVITWKLLTGARPASALLWLTLMWAMLSGIFFLLLWKSAKMKQDGSIALGVFLGWIPTSVGLAYWVCNRKGRFVSKGREGQVTDVPVSVLELQKVREAFAPMWREEIKPYLHERAAEGSTLSIMEVAGGVMDEDEDAPATPGGPVTAAALTGDGVAAFTNPMTGTSGSPASGGGAPAGGIELTMKTGADVVGHGQKRSAKADVGHTLPGESVWHVSRKKAYTLRTYASGTVWLTAFFPCLCCQGHLPGFLRCNCPACDPREDQLAHVDTLRWVGTSSKGRTVQRLVLLLALVPLTAYLLLYYAAGLTKGGSGALTALITIIALLIWWYSRKHRLQLGWYGGDTFEGGLGRKDAERGLIPAVMMSRKLDRPTALSVAAAGSAGQRTTANAAVSTTVNATMAGTVMRFTGRDAFNQLCELTVTYDYIHIRVYQQMPSGGGAAIMACGALACCYCCGLCLPCFCIAKACCKNSNCCCDECTANLRKTILGPCSQQQAFWAATRDVTVGVAGVSNLQTSLIIAGVLYAICCIITLAVLGAINNAVDTYTVTTAPPSAPTNCYYFNCPAPTSTPYPVVVVRQGEQVDLTIYYVMGFVIPAIVLGLYVLVAYCRRRAGIVLTVPYGPGDDLRGGGKRRGGECCSFNGCFASLHLPGLETEAFALTFRPWEMDVESVFRALSSVVALAKATPDGPVDASTLMRRSDLLARVPRTVMAGTTAATAPAPTIIVVAAPPPTGAPKSPGGGSTMVIGGRGAPQITISSSQVQMPGVPAPSQMGMTAAPAGSFYPPIAPVGTGLAGLPAGGYGASGAYPALPGMAQPDTGGLGFLGPRPSARRSKVAGL